MLTLIRYELIKTYRKLRTYIGFGLISILTPIVYWGLSQGGEDMVRGMTRGLQNDFLFVGTLFNGWFVAHLVMNALMIHVPFLIVLVSGDIFAGEATGGTFRMILTRPPSRTRIFLVKLKSTMIYTYSLVFFLALVSIGLGLILFGSGDLLALYDGITILPGNELWWRFILAYLLAGWSMCIVASLGLLFSTIVENAIGPIVGAMAVVILFFILGNLPFEFFESIKPFLFTTYMDVWRQAFTEPVDWQSIVRSCFYLALFFVVFIVSSWVIFTRKDVLS